jgi:hypothetical protein
MEKLPTHVGNALSKGLDAPWVRRGEQILARWKLEPTGDAARILKARAELASAVKSLEGLGGRELVAIREVLEAQLTRLKTLSP